VFIITRNDTNLHIYTQQDRSWREELAQVVTDPAELLHYLELNPQDYVQDIEARRLFPMRVPRPFMALMQKQNPNDPLLKQVLPLKQEFIKHPDYVLDPLVEHETPCSGLLHKYRSRVLLMLRTGCAVNCRYCFRRHFPYQDNHLNQEHIQKALEYIAQDTQINEVILSGGDPLMATDQHICALIERLEAMPHIKRLRIHSRLPVVIPSRLTQELAQALHQSRLQAILVLHINHPQEVSVGLEQGLRAYQQAGVTLLNQAVLLQGVNDEAATQIALSEALFKAQILPYYLHLLDKVEGAAHFDLESSQAFALIDAMRIALPGFLVPRLVREQAGELSKTILA